MTKRIHFCDILFTYNFNRLSFLGLFNTKDFKLDTQNIFGGKPMVFRTPSNIPNSSSQPSGSESQQIRASVSSVSVPGGPSRSSRGLIPVHSAVESNLE